MSNAYTQRFVTTAVMTSLLIASAGACNVLTGADDIRFSDEMSGVSSNIGAGGNVSFSTIGAGGDDGGFKACATASDEAKVMPINMYIAVDRSGSMQGHKWNSAKSAFTSFFQDPAADSLKVALRFWPDNTCHGPGMCNVNGGCYSPHVPLGSLADPNHESQLISAFNAHYPVGGTPMSAALQGATQWCMDNQAQNHGSEVSVVVLLSDGQPTQCNTAPPAIVSIARDAYDQAEVRTFAVGLQGSNEKLMNSIAKAGLTDHGHFIGNGNTKDELLAALQDIQGSLACAYAMPEADNPNDVIDPNQVNVTYTPSGAADAEVLAQVSSVSGCGFGAGGWYYDDPTDPQMIKLCPDTCDRVKDDEGGKMKIVVGCETLVN